MARNELQRAWSRQAMLDAERGVIQCRMCGQRSGLEHTTTLWRNGDLVFAACDGCAASHEVFMRPTRKGVEVRGRRVTPLMVRAVP